MLESIEKLRGYVSEMAEGGLGNDARNIDFIIDDIEREVAECYIELPLDADGWPIHIGDYLESEELGRKRFPCHGLDVDVFGNGKRWMVCNSYDNYSGTSEYTPAAKCHHVVRHVKNQNLRDVLLDFVEEITDMYENSLDEENPDILDKLVGGCADKVKAVMGR